MQLNKKPGLRKALGAATCGLLGVPAVASAFNPGAVLEGAKWDVGTLFYNEKDRISVIEPVIKATRDFGDQKKLGLKFTYDSISGASPNGASAANQAQTFTTPSGNTTYTVPSGETPMNPDFKDIRYALGGTWEQPMGRLNLISVGADFSSERDYNSIGINVSWSHDLNQRNTTLTAGLSLQRDNFEPAGGMPVELSQVGSATAGEGDGAKTVTDLLLGVTQVVNRTTIFQVNYSFSNSSGYMTDPYKIVSVVDDDSTNGITDGNTVNYLNEKRPSKRVKQSLYGELRKHFTEDMVATSYRYFLDDWGITSHTIDGRYRYALPSRSYLEPHVRLYMQNKADFYRHSIRSSEGTPANVSADYRLGKLNGTTIGLKFGKETEDFAIKSWSILVEYYRLDGEHNPSDAIGSQRNQDLFPTLHAYIVQAVVTF